MMNRLGLVLGVAAVATLAGCSDADKQAKTVAASGKSPLVTVEGLPKGAEVSAKTEIKVDPVTKKKCVSKVVPSDKSPVKIMLADGNGKPLDNVKSDVKIEIEQIPAPPANK